MRNGVQTLRTILGALMAVTALAAVSLPPAHAQAGLPSERERAVLDGLFDQLRYAPDEESAREIDRQIWIYWTVPSDAELAARMADILQLRRLMDWPGALSMLDELVADYPDYAEGWNQRATIHFLLGDEEASLADIEKTLALEPRHFGALSGQALIYRQQGKEALALKSMSGALSVHPFLAERALFPQLLQGITRL